MTKKRRRLKPRFFIIFLALLAPLLFTGLTVVKSYATEDSSKKKINETPKGEVLSESGIKDFKEIEKRETEKIHIKKPIPKLPEGKIVYLTFDDGPSQFTNQLLDVLKEHDVPATFFMQGINLQQKALQASVKRTVEEGHYIGAHSMTHDFQKLYKENQFVSEMQKTLALIQEITGQASNLVRAPYGSAPGLNSTAARDQMAALDMKLWDWTIDSEDWAFPKNPAKILANVKASTHLDTEVVLMHEKQQTLTILPEIIAYYKSQGYSFVAYHEAHHFSLNFQNDGRL